MKKRTQFIITTVGVVFFSLSTLLNLIQFTEPIRIFNHITPFILALFCASYGGYLLNRDYDILKQKVKSIMIDERKSDHDTLAEVYNILS